RRRLDRAAGGPPVAGSLPVAGSRAVDDPDPGTAGVEGCVVADPLRSPPGSVVARSRRDRHTMAVSLHQRPLFVRTTRGRVGRGNASTYR
ncbi:MAG: hypothetical protein WBG36_12045, partial [Ornithinimicrobium sp.]